MRAGTFELVMDFFYVLNRLQRVRINKVFKCKSQHCSTTVVWLYEIHYSNGACILLKLLITVHFSRYENFFGSVHPLNIMCKSYSKLVNIFFIYIWQYVGFVKSIFQNIWWIFWYDNIFCPFPALPKTYLTVTLIPSCVCTFTPILKKQTSHQRRWANVQKIGWITILRKKEKTGIVISLHTWFNALLSCCSSFHTVFNTVVEFTTLERKEES